MKKLFLNALKFIFSVAVVFVVVTLFIVIIFKWYNPPVTAFMQKNMSKSYLGIFDKPIIKQKWTSFDNISNHIKIAVIASEDQRFKEHFGFDVEAIEDAIDEMKRGRRVRGASTISQQVAKNIFLTDHKNYFRKAFEAYFTVLIEIFWSKKRILEVYLNTAEMGENLYGIEAASKKYFKKTAGKLSAGESALIAALLPSPKKFNPLRPSNYLLKRKSRILRQMELLGGISFLKDL